MTLIDSHCHLDHFSADDQAELVARAERAGVTRMVTIGTRLHQAAVQKAIAERFPQVWCTVGIHPHQAGEGELPSVEQIVAETDHPKVIGIGESGLDYFYDKSPRDVQQENFRRHIRAARAAGMPLCIHARDADADVAAILAEETNQGGPFAFLLHCFSSGAGLAEAALALGGTISFSGILTFPKSDALRAIARDVPLDRLLVETDSPFLAPVPLRGKRCEPAYTMHTARVLAAVKGVSEAEIARITTENFYRLYPKAA